MELIEMIRARRSIRKYDADKKVSLDQIKEMIQCASYAPSWKNSQTPRYHVISTKEKINA